MSDRPESLAAALAELQQHLPRIGKDAQAQYGKYADLADVNRALLPLLAERGFSWTCMPTLVREGQFVLRYRLRLSGTDEQIGGDYPLPTGNPQTIGSAITYARRYCLLAVTGAAPDEDDDDDAQAAEQAARAQRRLPPETDEHGAATQAELTRMDRGHEPGTWRASSTAENDGWYDQPASDMPVENQPGTSLSEQRRSIYIALGKHGIKDFKSAIERLIRRDLDDPKGMSYNEAVSVLARVRSWDGRTEELLAPLAAIKEGTDA